MAKCFAGCAANPMFAEKAKSIPDGAYPAKFMICDMTRAKNSRNQT
jgi:hypothetical protein